MLARYGQVFPASAPYLSESEEEREELQQRLRRRRPRVAQRVQERRNRLDKAVAAQCDPPPPSHAVPQCAGVGLLTAALRVAFLPKLGQRGSKALTLLVGLAPWSRDRGHKRGQRSIRGGRAAVRHALYMVPCS